MKRIVIFAAYDKNGIIHDYVLRYLRYLREISEKIIFVADNEITPTERNKLKGLTYISLCEHHGEYDFGSYKRGFLYAKNNGLLNNVDELVFCNDSCFCVDKLNTVFDEMSQRNCDFWGMTESIEIQRHLQSFFLAFRKTLFEKEVFENFWGAVKKQSSFWDIVLKYEVPLRNKFEQEGFKSDSFIKVNQNYNITIYPVGLLKMGCPLVKRKVFSQYDYSRESVRKTFKLIDKIFPESTKEILNYFGMKCKYRLLLKLLFPFFLRREVKHQGSKLRYKVKLFNISLFTYKANYERKDEF